MDNLYAIHGTEIVITLVKANSKEEALEIFACNQIEDRKSNDFITNLQALKTFLESFIKTRKITLLMIMVMEVSKGYNN